VSYIIESPSNYYLNDTQVPNWFIAEYLPGAPGDYVKVYLYAFMRAARRDVASNESLARALGVALEDVLAAWTYFEGRGLVRKHYPDASDATHYDVIFTDMKPRFGAACSADAAEPESEGGSGEKLRSALDDEEVRDMFRDIERLLGGALAGADIARLGSLLDEGASPALILFAYRYCAERRRNTRAAYVAEVVRRWSEAGVRTAEDAEAHVLGADVRMDQYRQIMKALGLHISSITDAEKQVFDRWLDEFAFTTDEILAAAGKAAGKRNKFDYVKKILESDYEAMTSGGLASVAGGSGGVARKGGANPREKYYADARAHAEAEAESHRREVYGRLPEVERLDKDIARLNRESVSAIMSRSDGGRSESARLAAEIEKKLAAKAEAMTRAGYAADYMEIKYRCPICRDTGIKDGGGACGCFGNLQTVD
jgi:DnaD/phage-associated family protein